MGTRMKILVVGDSTYAKPVCTVLNNAGIQNSVKLQKTPVSDNAVIDTAGLIIFTGGEDVNPSLYGHPVHYTTYVNIAREERIELPIYRRAYERKIPMMGICRGSQFLWVMRGGNLIQNVDNHTYPHYVLDLTGGKTYSVTSTHHQAANLSSKPQGICILAVVSPTISTLRETYDQDSETFVHCENGVDVEAWVDEDRNILGVQWHPEFLDVPVSCTELTERYIKKYLRDLFKKVPKDE